MGNAVFGWYTGLELSVGTVWSEFRLLVGFDRAGCQYSEVWVCLLFGRIGHLSWQYGVWLVHWFGPACWHSLVRVQTVGWI